MDGVAPDDFYVTTIYPTEVRLNGRWVRITGQLDDATTGKNLWSERFEGRLDDIFALQDEISEAIVKVLKLKLLPEEKEAIERHSTTNPEAYKLYLMARHYSVMGTLRHHRVIVRMCRRALEIDADYARAWALLAIGLSIQRFGGESVEGGMDAAERALALDPSLPDAHAAKGRVLTGLGRYDEAVRELNIALGLDPDRLILVETAHRKETLWAMEEAVRSAAPAAVVGVIDTLDLKLSQRLHLAATDAGLPLFLLRPAPTLESSAAATRWRIGTAKAARDRFGLVTRPRWHLQLERCRNGRPGEWVVEYDHVAHRFSLAAALADSALPRDANENSFSQAG